MLRPNAGRLSLGCRYQSAGVAAETDRYPRMSADDLGWLTTDEMVEVDRVMIDELHIELVQMMENAGRNLARLAVDRYRPGTAVVVAGRGGNGGGGLVAARHLANRGLELTVVTTRPVDAFSGVPRHQLDIVQRMGLTVIEPDTPGWSSTVDRVLAGADVVLDAVIGYSLSGPPTGAAAEAIAAINRAGGPVVSLDAPSGLDTTTGEVPGVAVDTDLTLTLAAPKLGLRDAGCVGRLFVGDISVPPGVLHGLGHAPPNFTRSPILAVS